MSKEEAWEEVSELISSEHLERCIHPFWECGHQELENRLKEAFNV